MTKQALITCLSMILAFGLSAQGRDNPSGQTENHALSDSSLLVYCYQAVSSGNVTPIIYTIRMDGTQKTRVSLAGYEMNHPDWSPDAAKIAVASQVNASTYSIRVMNADGNDVTRLTATSGVLDAEPNWSPDGTRIAFTRIYPSQDMRRELWIMNADGSDAHALGPLLADAAEWSPDSGFLIYSSNVSGFYEIYTCRPDGGDVLQVTALNSSDPLQPSWSPNGRFILFNTNHSANDSICVMNPDGTGLRKLMGTSAGIWKSMVSPDGKTIAFGSWPEGEPEHWEIFVMDSDGTDIRRVTTSTGSSTSVDPDWRPGSSMSVHDAGGRPAGFMLRQNHPNPFNPSTTIRFSILKKACTRVDVFNVLGVRIRTLVDGVFEPGEHSLVWDGRNGFGEEVPSGAYFFRLTGVGFSQTRKGMLLK